MASRSLNVVIAGDVSPSFTRAMGQADRAASDLTVRFGALSGSIGTMLPALAGAAPALTAVAAAGTSVAASLGAAAGGAGALGAGFAASMAPVLIVGKQVTSRFEEIKKAQEAVVQAQKDGTAESKKAADAALADLSRNERAMVTSLGKLAGLQDKVLGGASDRVFGGLSRAIDVLAPKLEGLAAPFTRLGGAIGDSIGRVGDLLASGPWQDAFKSFVDSATSLVGPLTTTFLSIGNIIRDVATTALPYVQEAVEGVARWFGDLDDAATRSRVSEIVGTLVEHTRSWFNLFREVGGLVGQVFGSTASSGQSVVDTLAGAVSAVSDFVRGLREGSGAGGEFAEKVRTAIDAVSGAVATVRKVVSAWVRENRGDINSVIDAFRAVGRFARDVFEDTLVPIIRRSIRAIRPIVEGFSSWLRGVVRFWSGLLSGDWAKAWDGAKEGVRGALKLIKSSVITALGNVGEVVADFGPKIIKGIVKGLANMGKALATGIWEGIKWAAAKVPELAADALKGLGSAIGKQITNAIGNIFGDGLGSALGDGVGKMASSVPAFGGGLQGANPALAPIAGIGSRFGLGVTSGRAGRENKRTSSGNVSWHSSGEAIDVAGSPAGMLGFFNYMKNTMGGRLAELIYTPGGAGIKNGQSYTYGGKVAADHFDHVHVAMDLGHPGIGVGDGLGRFDSTAYGPPWNAMNGTGVTANGTDLRPARKAYGVAVDPNVIPLGSKLRITPNPFNYSGTFTAFDTGGAIKGNRIDFYDWRGRKSQMGWGKAPVNVELVTDSVVSTGGAKPKNGKGTSGTASGGPTPRVTPDFYARPEPLSDEAQRAMDYANRTGIYAPGRPLKGGGPTKGFTPNEVAQGLPDFYRDRAVKDEPTWEDIIGSNIVRARLTAGDEDDIAAANHLAWYRKQIMDQALANGDPRDDAQAIDAWVSATEALKTLQGSVDEANRLQQQRDDLLKEQVDNQNKILALAQQGPQILAAVIAAVNGDIGGRVGLGFGTPGYAGAVASYSGAGRL